MPYSNKLMYRRVMKLFMKFPEYRDSGDKTRQYILITYFTRAWGRNALDMMKLGDSISRAFREVQQDHPELRGKEWTYRQWISGEISFEQYKANNGGYSQQELF